MAEREPPTLRYLFVAAFNEYIRRHGAASSVHDAACSAEMIDLLADATKDAGYRKVNPDALENWDRIANMVVES